MLEKMKYEIMLLDVYLFKENGLDHLPKFKALYPSMSVIVLTGSGYNSAMMKSALKNGAIGYFSKDSGLENLVEILNRVK
jgi:response regulator of citrate/malate metabolism